MNSVKTLVVYYNPTPKQNEIKERRIKACSVTGAVLNAKQYVPHKVREFTVFDPETGTFTDTIIFTSKAIGGKYIRNVAIINPK